MPAVFNRAPSFARCAPYMYYPRTKKDLTFTHEPSLPPWAREFYAVRLTGYMNVPASGDWTIEMVSDDGAILWIDGQEFINMDGLHVMRHGYALNHVFFYFFYRSHCLYVCWQVYTLYHKSTMLKQSQNAPPPVSGLIVNV